MVFRQMGPKILGHFKKKKKTILNSEKNVFIRLVKIAVRSYRKNNIYI